jgi:hypothetical protein
MQIENGPGKWVLARQRKAGATSLVHHFELLTESYLSFIPFKAFSAS